MARSFLSVTRKLGAASPKRCKRPSGSVYSKTVKSSDVIGFAELTGDRNPIHLSEHFAAKTPFKGRIAHGLYTASLISAVIGTRLPGPGAVYLSQTLTFKAPVKIGDVVEASVQVAELID